MIPPSQGTVELQLPNFSFQKLYWVFICSLCFVCVFVFNTFKPAYSIEGQYSWGEVMGSLKVSSCPFHLWYVLFSLTFLNFSWLEMATHLRSAAVVALYSELFSCIFFPPFCLCFGFCAGERRVIQIGNSLSSITACFALVYFFNPLNPVEFKLFWWVFSLCSLW